jgi:hypothetical protein
MLIQRVEGLYKAASFGNLLIFLYTGRYYFKHELVLLLVFHFFSFLESSLLKILLILRWYYAYGLNKLCQNENIEWHL